jgi:transposase
MRSWKKKTPSSRKISKPVHNKPAGLFRCRLLRLCARVYIKPAARKRHRKPGRKNGHPGIRRATPVHIDQTVEHKLTECPDCHKALGTPCGRHTRIVEDSPPVRPTVTEHVDYEYYCSPCGKKVSGPVTEALPKATMGLRLTLLSAFLHYALGMTTRNICTWLRTFCQFPVTPGGLVLQWQRLAEILKPVYENLALEALNPAILNIDESGWRGASALAKNSPLVLG